MPQLFLLRHLQSQWNLENRFTGWVDVPLSKEGIKGAKEIAEKLSSIDSECRIDIVYSSPLVRNTETVLRIFEYLQKYPLFLHLRGKMKKWGEFKELTNSYLPVFFSENLNERYYGKLQGENKKELMEKYGEEKVRLWRRSYNVAPPGGESLKDVVKRAVPFYKKYIERDLKEGKNVLVVASHNSLRAIVKYIENISDEDIINLEISYAGLLKYEFDIKLNLQQKEIM